MTRRDATAASLLFVGLTLALYLGNDERGPSARLQLDAPYYHVYLVSLAGDGDLDFTDEYKRTRNYEKLGTVAATGRPANHFSIGPAIFAAPFYALGAAVAAVAGEATDGFGALHVKLTLLASPFFTAASLIFMARTLRRRGLRLPLVAGLLALAAGPAFYYAVRQPGNSHPAATFFTAWLIDVWDASYDRPRTLGTWLLLGALLGATALARPQLALWGVLLVAAAVDDLRRGRLGELLPRWLAGGAAALAVFAPQLAVWKVIYGSWLVVPQGDGFMVWSAPCWSEVLFASRNGLLAWSPLYAVALLGLAVAARRLPRLALLLLLSVALQVVANGAVWDWWAGPSFGGRRFDSCVAAFAVGLGALLSLHRAIAAATLAVALLCAAGNVRAAVETSVWDQMDLVGRPMREALTERMGPWLGSGVAALSQAATLPARAAFAWRHGTGLDAYDRVVGAHFTTEYFPGLGGVDRRLQGIRLRGDEPYLIGFEATKSGARLREGRARVLVPLNKRTGPVKLRLRARREAPMRAFWNGRLAGEVAAGRELALALDPVDRDVHTLAIEAPAGTVIFEAWFDVDEGTPP